MARLVEDLRVFFLRGGRGPGGLGPVCRSCPGAPCGISGAREGGSGRAASGAREGGPRRESELREGTRPPWGCGEWLDGILARFSRAMASTPVSRAIAQASCFSLYIEHADAERCSLLPPAWETRDAHPGDAIRVGLAVAAGLEESGHGVAALDRRDFQIAAAQLTCAEAGAGREGAVGIA